MREKKSERWLLIAIVLIACNLRAAITGVGSLVGMIQRDLSLSSTVSGLITTIPLLAFAVVSPLASGLAPKRGLGKTLFAGFVVLAAGILVRSYLGTAGLFLGTVLVGGGIAIGNVLIPALIKGRFPQRVGSLTSLYTTAMAVFSGVAAGVSVPLANQVGWRNTLAIWVVLAVLALIVWFPQRGVVLEHKAQQGQHKPLLKSGTAWWVSVYMGVQSLLFYSFVAWLPTILQAKGLSAETAGYFFSVYQFISIAGSCLSPLLAGRRRSQVGLVTGLFLLYVTGLLCIQLGSAPMVLLPGVALCGFCSGACISLAMTYIGLRTENAADATRLSGMSQSIGYLIAAAGPFVTGWLYDMLGSWTVPLWTLIAVACIMGFTGRKAGRDRVI